MAESYIDKWKKRLNPKRFRGTTAKNTPAGWNPFDSDYARITMSAPFRRLQDKAQVFPLESSDFVRTRLTHSIEVSSVARSLGVRVENWLLEENFISQNQIGHIPSILSTASLAHDIGNPPFGHFGEECIRKFFRDKDNGTFFEGLTESEIADLKYFDGNVQGLRLLLRLGLSADEFSYNLTFPTLATVVKYPKDSVEGNKAKKAKGVSFKKYGFYQTDKDKFRIINDTLGLSNERHPLCFILESADDICYSISDIEDGFKKNTMSLDYLKRTLEKQFKDDAECSELADKILEWEAELSDNENKKSLIAQNCRIFAQTKMIESTLLVFKEKHKDIINGNFNEELLDNSPSKQLLNFFKDISVRNFNHETVIKSEIIGETVISYLLEKLTAAILSPDCENTKTISGKLAYLFSHQARYAREKTEYDNEIYLKLLMVVDFVASMTDSYALSLYQELRGIK